MADSPEFSGQGDRPTRFESWLVQACEGDGHWEMAAQRLALELGPELAATALALVFDELGGEKVHVPRRDRFFRGLWGERMREWARARIELDGWTFEEVGAVLRVSRGSVARIVSFPDETKPGTVGYHRP